MSESRPHYRVFSEIIARRGARVTELASACGTSNSNARKTINDLIDADHVRRVGALHYVSDGGVEYAAAHSGIGTEEMKRSVSLAPRRGALPSTVRTKRVKAISEMDKRFRQSGFEVFDGRRMGIGRPADKQPWHPDLWVPIPASGRRPVWHAVLVDPSTQADSTIREILRNYRSAARRDPDNRPLLVVCRDDAVAQLFDEIGDDLAMMVAICGDCLNGPFSGSESIWRFRGGVEGIDFLAKQMA